MSVNYERMWRYDTFEMLFLDKSHRCHVLPRW